MKFRTEASFKPSEVKIHPKDKIMLLGSCFSDNIGKKLHKYKLNATYNPLGIVYNPYSLFKLMSYYGIDGTPVILDELWHHNGIISHRDFHSNNNSLSGEEYIIKIEEKLDHFCDALLTTDWLFITFGTSWVYRHLKTDQIVSNCHKLPSSHFRKEILSIVDIIKYMDDHIHRLVLINPDIQIVLTVSPVRHLKDGMIENNVSKSRLIESTYRLTQLHPQVQYFPSYEIINDDLRDYRFYGEDLVHPSDIAIEYIWEKFIDYFFDSDSKALLKKIEKITNARSHRIFQPSRDALLHFTKRNLAILSELKKKAPYLDLSEELAYFNMLKSKTKKN